MTSDGSLDDTRTVISAARDESFQVVVIGAGQAGLSASKLLTDRGVHHVVLERHQIGHEWRQHRWDTFCLVTPNWQCRLPGFPYAGDDPEGFMPRAEIVSYLEEYAASFGPPVREGVDVIGVSKREDGRFAVRTDRGTLSADAVVVAIGGYHRPIVPPVAAGLPDSVTQMQSAHYRRPEDLPEGGVLVVGSGQSGTQIAEDLFLAGRDVHLCTGKAPRVNRAYRGRDVVAWLEDMGYYDIPYDEHPQGERVRAKTNHYVTGRDGGRDIDLRVHAKAGMRLYGRLEAIEGTEVRFAPDLASNLDQADATALRIRELIDEHIAKHAIDAPPEPVYTPPWTPDREVMSLDLDAAGVRSVVWCLGFKPNFGWAAPDILDAAGYPKHHRGVSETPGLYFLGLPWQHTWGSARFSGVARDAEYVVEHVLENAVRGIRTAATV
ncbi:MAG: MSMEG_0569 family flavin-dependent oxidoreductase [Planctomycetota bacterium]